MSDAQHTPGPWTVSAVYVDAARVIGPDGFPVADPEATAIREGYEELGIDHWADAPGRAYIERPESEWRANARLIAAAPETLNELKQAVAQLEAIYEECKRRNLFEVTVEQFRRLDAHRAVIAKAEGKAS